jgi:hypothetical protein
MSYVIYETESTRLLRIARRGHLARDRWSSAAAAKAALTRADRDGKLNPDTVKADYSIATGDEFYSHIEKQVWRKNLMSGKMFLEGLNTPCYLSPASETYWSM